MSEARRPCLATLGALSLSLAIGCRGLTPTGASVPTLEVLPATLTLPVGATSPLTALLGGQRAPDRLLTWSSSDERVVTVDALGNVTCLRAGVASVTATAPDALDGPDLQSTAIVTCEEPALFALDAERIEYVHTIGVSPCDEPAGTVTLTNTGTSAISVAVELGGLEGLGARPSRIDRLDPGQSAQLTLVFTCRVRESFSGQVTLTARDSAGRVQARALEVDVTVR